MDPTNYVLLFSGATILGFLLGIVCLLGYQNWLRHHPRYGRRQVYVALAEALGQYRYSRLQISFLWETGEIRAVLLDEHGKRIRYFIVPRSVLQRYGDRALADALLDPLSDLSVQKAMRARTAENLRAAISEEEKPKANYTRPVHFTATDQYGSQADGEDDVYTIAEFRQCIQSQAFVDDDGYGHPVRDSKSDPEIDISPSTFEEQLPGDATHIVWFNK